MASSSSDRAGDKGKRLMDHTAKNLVIVRIDGGICSQINFFAYGHAVQNMLGERAKVKYDLSWFKENGKDYFGKFVRNWDFPKAFPDLAVEEASAEEIAATKSGARSTSPSFSLCRKSPPPPISKGIQRDASTCQDATKSLRRTSAPPTPGLRRIAFDFKSREPDAPVFGVDVDMLANLLKAECSVRDYRSKEEIAAYEEKRRGKRGKKLRRKMEEIGASTMPQYVLRRIRRVWRRVLSAIGPKAIGAHAAQRKYEQLLLLGATRETAFRFKARWGFVDASLFSAASSDNLATLADALKQPDAIAKGAFTLEERKQAWRSADFGLEFKVKLQWKEGMPPLAKSQMDEDLADLRVRLEKLAEDFRTRLANDKETLLVYRLAKHEGGKPESGRTA